MITGFVNVEFEPIIPLSIRRADGKVFTQDAIVDTDFNDRCTPTVSSLLVEFERLLAAGERGH